MNRYRDPTWLREQYHDREQTLSEIADECGVSAPTIHYWMDRHNISRRSQGHEGGRTPIPERQLLDGLRAVAAALGHAPSKREYSDLYQSIEEAPSTATLRNRFGSYNSAKAAAGLDTTRRNADNTTGYSSDECLHALVAVAERAGVSVTTLRVETYRRQRIEGEPSVRIIYNHFDGWDSACRTAASTDRKGWSHEACIAALQAAAADGELNPRGTLTVRAYDEWRSDARPSSRTIKDVFGSWTNALDAAEIYTPE